MQNVKKLVGFETFLVIFLFSYQIKNMPFFESLPDLTTSLAFILIPWGLWIAKREGHIKHLYQNKTLLLLLLFWAWMTASYFWSPQTFFSKSKIVVHSLFTMPVVFYASLFIASSPERLRRLFVTFVLFSLPVLFEILRLFFMSDDPFSGSFIFGANYLITGQTLGVALIIIYTYALKNITEGSTQKAFFYIALSSSFAFSFFYTGGRGPLVAIVLSLLIMTLIYKRKEAFSRRFLTLISVTGLATLQHFLFRFLGAVKESKTLERLLNTYDTSKNIIDKSSALRLEYYSSAWQAFQENILMGLGIAGWPTYVGREEINSHPHNIFLEIAAELGVIGLLLFCSACLILLPKLGRLFFKEIPPTHDYILLGFLIFAALNALKSGDLNDNILLFFILGLISSTHVSKRKPPQGTAF